VVVAGSRSFVQIPDFLLVVAHDAEHLQPLPARLKSAGLRTDKARGRNAGTITTVSAESAAFFTQTDLALAEGRRRAGVVD